MLIASPWPIFIPHFSSVSPNTDLHKYLLSSVLMMFVGTCEITGDDEADHDVPGDDNDDSDDVAVITTGGR